MARLHLIWWPLRMPLFMGGFEALLIPAVTLVVSMWYRPAEQPRRNSIILNVVAPIINGFVAWVVSYYPGTFATWKIIFLFVGSFTTVWAGVVYLFLPKQPRFSHPVRRSRREQE